MASFATSYIKTEGTAVTRAADSLSRTLGAEWNPSAHTVLFEASPGSKSAFSISDGTTSNRLVWSTPSMFLYAVNGTAYAYFEADYSGAAKLAVSIRDGLLIAAADGVVVHTDTSVIPPAAADTLKFGSRSGHVSQQRVKGFRLYPHAMTAAELEALTS